MRCCLSQECTPLLLQFYSRIRLTTTIPYLSGSQWSFFWFPSGRAREIAMAAGALTSSMASLSLRESLFHQFNGLVAEPSARFATPSPAQGVMRKSLRIEAAAGEGLAGKGPVRIRLVRFGRKKLPYYRIIIANSRCRRDGRFLEMVGRYNPMADKNGEKDIQVNSERIKYWLSVGAQPSDTVRDILYKQGVMTNPASAAES